MQFHNTFKTNEKATYDTVNIGQLSANNSLKHTDHVVNKTNNELHTCIQCNKSFGHVKLLRRHLINHNEHRAYKCSKCFSKFKTCDVFKKHYHRMHPEIHFTKPTFKEKYPFKCSTCIKYFSSCGQLAKHLLYRHNRQSSKQTLNSSNDSRNKESCLETEPKKLIENEIVHRNDDNFSETLSDSEEISNNANQNETFTCNQCQQSFKKLKALKRHLIIHNTYKPYLCSICIKRCIQKTLSKSSS
jgi:KRAB domain-containing zinc finger protein